MSMSGRHGRKTDAAGRHPPGRGGLIKKLVGNGPVGKTVLMAFAVYAKAFKFYNVNCNVFWLHILKAVEFYEQQKPVDSRVRGPKVCF